VSAQPGPAPRWGAGAAAAGRSHAGTPPDINQTALHRPPPPAAARFNVYVSQPEVKPGCVLRRANFNVLERRGLVDGQQVAACKRNMNTFAFVGDLEGSPEVSCVYHSEEAENQVGGGGGGGRGASVAMGTSGGSVGGGTLPCAGYGASMGVRLLPCAVAHPHPMPLPRSSCATPPRRPWATASCHALTRPPPLHQAGQRGEPSSSFDGKGMLSGSTGKAATT
jgi:hypothetical protein